MVPLVCFCRVAGCFLVLPGFAHQRVPVRFRLSIAVMLSFTISPLVGSEVGAALNVSRGALPIRLVIDETVVGIFMGLLSRLLFAALQFAGAFVAALLGLMAPASGPLDEGDPLPPPADLIVLSAIVLLFANGLHLELLAAILGSYSGWPPGHGLEAGLALERLLEVTEVAFKAAVGLISPLLVVVLLVNLALGIANRIAPMLPLQFLGAPLIAHVGLMVLAGSAGALLDQVMRIASAIVAKGG